MENVSVTALPREPSKKRSGKKKIKVIKVTMHSIAHGFPILQDIAEGLELLKEAI
ncbi:hypothetical protein TIFTF001_006757 [Ficus carica]|uniref:Uncharacterized protein n=1 Tax=Ficus carica TaxID=3494 RepID=A0AA87ZPM9_FICCA|nr:hypothetical protein TIFTF001_006757 [Ficus carica]